MTRFSFEGQLYTPVEKKFRETILLTPFFGSHRLQLGRHIQFLNGLGFSVVTYALINDLSLNAFSAEGKFGFKHVWADQIEKLLSEIDGDKIVFALSNVAAGAVEAIARRRATDIRALVCDSGPSGHFALSAWNLVGKQLGEKSLIRRAYKTAIGRVLWSLSPRPLKSDLKAFPTGFPVLAMSGGQDVLISAEQISAVFESHPQLALQTYNFPEAGHLEGLKKFPEEYGATVIPFLHAHTTAAGGN